MEELRPPIPNPPQTKQQQQTPQKTNRKKPHPLKIIKTKQKKPNPNHNSSSSRLSFLVAFSVYGTTVHCEQRSTPGRWPHRPCGAGGSVLSLEDPGRGSGGAGSPQRPTSSWRAERRLQRLCSDGRALLPAVGSVKKGRKEKRANSEEVDLAVMICSGPPVLRGSGAPCRAGKRGQRCWGCGAAVRCWRLSLPASRRCSPECRRGASARGGRSGLRPPPPPAPNRSAAPLLAAQGGRWFGGGTAQSSPRSASIRPTAPHCPGGGGRGSGAPSAPTRVL